MPYDIIYRPSIPPKGRPWKLYNIDKKKIVASSVSKEMAQKAARARMMGEHGVFKNPKYRGKNEYAN
jgi:hypothetical protein